MCVCCKLICVVSAKQFVLTHHQLVKDSTRKHAHALYCGTCPALKELLEANGLDHASLQEEGGVERVTHLEMFLHEYPKASPVCQPVQARTCSGQMHRSH